MTDGLVEQAQAVAHAAVGGPGEQIERRLFVGNLFGLEDALELGADTVRLQALEIELETAREHRHRHLLGVGGGEQKFDVGRWLFEGLEQSVEAGVGEHVHLVDEVHLVAPANGGEGHVFEQLAGLVHLGAGSRVHLDEIGEAPFVHLLADTASPAGGGAHPFFTVERLGQNPRQGGLAHAPGAGEEIGVMEAVVVQGVAQGAHHMFLPHHLGEVTGAPFASKYLIGHGADAVEEGGNHTSHTPAHTFTAAAAPFRA